jgi:hypothetical protein
MGVTLTYSGGSQVFNELFVKGFDNPDEVEFFIGDNEELADGTLYQRVVGFRRVITVGLLPQDLKTDRWFLAQFLFGSAKQITYYDETIDVTLKNPEGYSTEWLDDAEDQRYFQMEFREKAVMGIGGTIWPPTWTWDGYEELIDADGLPVYDSDGKPVYVKKAITI